MSASHTFARFVLRTTDAPAAQAFYAALLGHDRLSIVPLHEDAVARGARPHWLGQIEVDDVDETVRAFIEQGGTPLGPLRPTAATFPDGRRFSVLRDPGGAVVGFTSPAPNDEPRVVVWHQLNTNDRARVEHAYAALFGWRMTARVSDPEHGELQHFSWRGTDADVGAILDIQGRPGRHPHWLFHMRVADLDRAIATVQSAHGLVLGPFALPGGERMVVCDDPQGAAFALRG
jgi:predicted enzyme related to lactoylglutathione lyase